MSKTKYTDGIRRRVVREVRAGASITAAFQSAGIIHRTAWRWMKRGRDDIENGDESDFAKMVSDIEKAEGAALKDALAAVKAEPPSAWAWYQHLSQRHAEKDKHAIAQENAEQEQQADDPTLTMIMNFKSPRYADESDADYEARQDAELGRRLRAHREQQAAG